MNQERTTGFIKLKKVFNKLLGPEGCPWDKKQTHESLLPYLKEEVEEYFEAVKAKDAQNMKEELGDILLQVMLHSEIAGRNGKFSVEDVIDTLLQKITRRHPHVFGKGNGRSVKSIKQIILNWDKIKAIEKKHVKR